MVIVCDRSLRVLEVSNALINHIPNITLGELLTDLFVFTRPATIRSADDIFKHPKSLYLLIERNEQFALRGQMLLTQINGQEKIIFVGSPWLLWLNTNKPDVQLGLEDFAAGDAQMDQVVYISTKRQMVEDLELLNEELLHAKQEVEAAQVEKNVFYAQMSHEMRTPLNGVVSALSLLTEQTMPEQARKLLEMANRSSENLLKVINYVLDVARLETGHLDDEAQVFSLSATLHSAVEIVRPQILDSNISLTAEIDTDLSEYYIGLKERLHQVVLNLVSNAVKFTHKGKIQVRAGLSDNKLVRIEVVDTGIGIAPNLQIKIFEPFYTSVPNGRANEAGTGLGLDIVRRNVQILGGNLGVESDLGKGTLFWMELPLQATTERPQTDHALTNDESLDNKSLRGTVMLVEDNETNRMLCTMLLEGLGVEVLTEDNAEAAIQSIIMRKPDMVFMDIGLPNMDGHQATQILRASYDHESLPIVALTAYTSLQEQEKSVAAGMNDYLVKPVNKERFKECLLRWLPSQVNVDPAPFDLKPDVSILENLENEIGTKNLKKVVLKFCEEAVSDMARIENAQTTKGLAKAAHTLVSTCDSFALPMLAKQFRQLEQNVLHGNTASPESINTLGKKLRAALQELAIYVNNK